MKKSSFIIFAGILISCFVRCHSGTMAAAQDTVHQQQDSLNKAVKEKEQTYTQKDTKTLITELETVVLKGREPFNSLAFREMLKRKDASAELFASIKTTGQKEYFKVMALKKMNEGLYRKMGCDSICAVLANALQKSTLFNAWGLPHLYWESSAKAILECGSAAAPFLRPLLKDTRPAPVWGSEEIAEYNKYHYRVCDYAYALLTETNGKRLPQAENSAERDRLISAYLLSVK